MGRRNTFFKTNNPVSQALRSACGIQPSSTAGQTPDLKTQQSTPSDRAPRIPTILRGIPLAFPRRTAPILFSLSSSVKSVRSLRLMSCPRMSGPCNCTHKSSEDYRSVSPEQENAIFLSLLVKPRPALAT